LQDSVAAYESEKVELQAKLQEEKKAGEAQLKNEKEKFLAEHVVVKDTVRKACRSMPDLVQEEQEHVEA
jgi:hypothetical protein